MDLGLGDMPYIVKSGREDTNAFYGVLTLESLSDAAAVCIRLMGPGTHGHLFRSMLRFGEWYKIRSRTEEV